MFRYRCPQCRQVLQAPEIRAGKATVCPKCSTKITIPADPAQWLTDSATPAKSEPRPAPAPRSQEFDDALAPIHVGTLEAATPAPEAKPRVSDRVPEPVAIAHAPEPVAPTAAVTEAPGVEPPPTRTPLPPSLPDPTPVPEVKVAPVEVKPAPEVKTAAPEVTPVPEVKAPPAPPPVAVERPQARRVVMTSVAPASSSHTPPEDTVSFNPPLHLRSEMDIAAALTDVLTTRMKPPPKPPRDLYISTAFWLLLTGIAAILLGLTLFKPLDYLKWVIYVGALQIVIGYVWIVALAFRRDPASAVTAAIPPITFMYLANKRYRRFRPLRFVLTGALLIVFALFGAPGILPQTRHFAGADESVIPVPGQDTASLSEIERLRIYKDKRQIDLLIDLLQKLDKKDPEYSASAPQRVELAAELRILADPALTSDSSVRAAALPAYVRWSGEASARDLVLLAVVKGQPAERSQAIKLLYLWKDPEVARVVASRLGTTSSAESELAKNALINIGGDLAVQAIVPILRDKEKDKTLHLTALELLAHPAISNQEALTFLRQEKDKFADTSLNKAIERTIGKIMDNLRQKGAG